MTVLVITDNDIERAGVESALARHGLEGRAWDPGGWDADSTPLAGPWQLVLIDVTLAPGHWDRLRAIERLHWLHPGLAGHVPVVGWSCARLATPARLRLARAGLTDLVEQPRRPTAADIAALCDGPGRGKEPMPSGAELLAVGLTAESDLDAGLALIVRDGLQDAFEPGFRVTGGLARRRSIRFRKEFAELTGLQTSRDRFSVLDDRDLTVPTWAEVARVVNQSRGASTGWVDEAGEPSISSSEFHVATAS